MHRRTFVKTVGATMATASVAGCLGYDLVSTSDVEARQATIDQQSTDIEQLQTTVEERESQIATLESEVEAAESDVADLETELESSRTARDGAIITMYSLGDDDYWTGADRFADGESRRGSESWSRAAVAYSDAAHRFQSAAVAYDQARRHAENAGYTDAAEIAAAASEAAIPAAEACSLLGDATLAMARGQTSEAEQHFQDAQEPLGLAIEREPESPEEFAGAI